MNPADFSVVVPAHVKDAESAANLAACLAALAACDPPPGEVVVVDDGSPVAFPRRPEPRFRWLRQENRGPAAARNAGARATTGPVLVFVDADVEVPVDCFARLAADFDRSPEAAAVWGTVTAAHVHRGLVSRYKNHTHRHFTHRQAAATRHLTTMLAAVRREAFEAAGGFDEALTTVSVEDVELGRELYERGRLVLLDRALEAGHRHRFTLLRAVRNDFHKARHHARTTLDRRAAGGASVRLDGPGERRQLHYLVGVPLGAGAALALLAGRWRLAAGFAGALAWWERDLLTYLAREEGPLFAAACLPLLVVERTTVAAAVVAGAADHARGRLAARLDRARPLPVKRA